MGLPGTALQAVVAGDADLEASRGKLLEVQGGKEGRKGRERGRERGKEGGREGGRGGREGGREEGREEARREQLSGGEHTSVEASAVQAHDIIHDEQQV